MCPLEDVSHKHMFGFIYINFLQNISYIANFFSNGCLFYVQIHNSVSKLHLHTYR